MSRTHAALPGLAAVAALALCSTALAAEPNAKACASDLALDRPVILALTAADILGSLDWTLRWSPPHRASVTYGLG